jgi:hypothetical protein
VIEAIVSGVMGLAPGHCGDDFDVSTMSRLPKDRDHASLTAVAIKQNHLDVTHTGTWTTRLKNSSGPVLRWRAEFPGTPDHLSVDGKSVSAKHSVTAEGVAISWTDVAVAPGVTVVVTK